jgi:hypothetical protein
MSSLILPKVPNWTPDFMIQSCFEYRFKLAEIFDFLGLSALWATAATWLYAIGHCGDFGHVLCHCDDYRDAVLATVANLIMRTEPLKQIWLCPLGHCLE